MSSFQKLWATSSSEPYFLRIQLGPNDIRFKIEQQSIREELTKNNSWENLDEWHSPLSILQGFQGPEGLPGPRGNKVRLRNSEILKCVVLQLWIPIKGNQLFFAWVVYDTIGWSMPLIWEYISHLEFDQASTNYFIAYTTTVSLMIHQQLWLEFRLSAM